MSERGPTMLRNAPLFDLFHAEFKRDIHPFVLDLGAVNAGQNIFKESHSEVMLTRFARAVPFDRTWWEFSDVFKTSTGVNAPFIQGQLIELVDGGRNEEFVSLRVEEYLYFPDHRVKFEDKSVKGGFLTRFTVKIGKDGVAHFDRSADWQPEFLRHVCGVTTLEAAIEGSLARAFYFLCAINATTVCDTYYSGVQVTPGKPFEVIHEAKGPIYCKINRLGVRYLRESSPNYFGGFAYAQHWVRAHVQPIPITGKNRKWTGRMTLKIVGPYLRGAEHFAPAKIKQRRITQ